MFRHSLQNCFVVSITRNLTHTRRSNRYESRRNTCSMYQMITKFSVYFNYRVLKLNILISHDFISFQRSVFDGKKPIRGGIPFVFPNHGPAPQGTLLPHNGFARISRWQLEKGPDRLHTGDVEAIFSLSDSDFTRSM